MEVFFIHFSKNFHIFVNDMKYNITSDFIEELAKDETTYALFFVSLISSDNILTKEDAEVSLGILEEIDKVIDDANISDEMKEKFKKYTKDGISICKEDIKRFKKTEYI